MPGRLARSVVLLLAVAGGFAAEGDSVGEPVPVGADPALIGKAEKREALVERRLVARRREIAAYRRLVWSCEEELRAPRSVASTSVWRLRRDVAYRSRIRDLWKGRLAGCATVRARRTLPATNDWQTAVRIAQRPYPGTSSWLLAISDREGGYGPWVWYGGRPWAGRHVGDDFLGADTVGGWMQFRFSTFEPYWRAARADLARRGFLLPELRMPAAGGDPRYVGWLSPLGQALTAGYMRFTHRDGCHWCLG